MSLHNKTHFWLASASSSFFFSRIDMTELYFFDAYRVFTKSNQSTFPSKEEMLGNNVVLILELQCQSSTSSGLTCQLVASWLVVPLHLEEEAVPLVTCSLPHHPLSIRYVSPLLPSLGDILERHFFFNIFQDWKQSWLKSAYFALKTIAKVLTPSTSNVGHHVAPHSFKLILVIAWLNVINIIGHQMEPFGDVKRKDTFSSGVHRIVANCQ